VHRLLLPAVATVTVAVAAAVAVDLGCSWSEQQIAAVCAVSAVLVTAVSACAAG
jgi:hypothetical protein